MLGTLMISSYGTIAISKYKKAVYYKTWCDKGIRYIRYLKDDIGNHSTRCVQNMGYGATLWNIIS